MKVLPPDWTLNFPSLRERLWFDIPAWLAAGIAVSVLFAGVIGYASYWLLRAALSKHPAVREALEHSPTARGFKRSVGLFCSTLVFEALVRMLELHQPPYEFTLFVNLIFRVLSLTWIGVVFNGQVFERLSHRYAEAHRGHQNLIFSVFERLTTWLIISVGLSFVAALSGVSLFGLIAGLGVGGVALALAAKDSVENLFGSVTVLIDAPFSIGDRIRFGDIDGIVESVTLRSTRIRTLEDTLYTVPNSNFIRASVENFGHRRWRRLKFTLSFEPTNKPEVLEAFCNRAYDALDRLPISQGHTITAKIKQLGETGVIFEADFKVEAANYADEARARHEASMLLLNLAQELQLPLIRR